MVNKSNKMVTKWGLISDKKFQNGYKVEYGNYKPQPPNVHKKFTNNLLTNNIQYSIIQYNNKMIWFSILDSFLKMKIL